MEFYTVIFLILQRNENCFRISAVDVNLKREIIERVGVRKNSL